jgi:hypothetical protein
MNVTTEDLLDALRDALAKPTDGTASTLAELIAATGYGNAKVRRLLKAVQAEGRLVVVKVYRANLMGTQSQVPAYRINPK